MSEFNDEHIINLFNKKESRNKAFNIIIETYQKPVYYHIRRMVINHEDADDLTQDTFIKVWKNLKHFKKNSKLFTWIYKIATNEAISFLNKKKRFLFLPNTNVEMHLANKLADDNLISASFIEQKFQKALLTLPQKQRMVFNMRYYDELKYEEISEILNTSVGALKASHHIAVKKIEDYLKNN